VSREVEGGPLGPDEAPATLSSSAETPRPIRAARRRPRTVHPRSLQRQEDLNEASTVGQEEQTAAGAKQRPDRIIITLPIHPLVGAELVLVRVERWIGAGRRFALVEHPEGGTLRLPLEWTDRGPRWVSPCVNGRPVRLAIGGLLKLAGALDVALGRTLAGKADRAERSAEEPAPPGRSS
jgi:hypothetical protein